MIKDALQCVLIHSPNPTFMMVYYIFCGFYYSSCTNLLLFSMRLSVVGFLVVLVCMFYLNLLFLRDTI